MEKHSINKEAAVRCTTDFKNAKKIGAREQRNTSFEVQKGSNCQIRTPQLIKPSSKNEVKGNSEKSKETRHLPKKNTKGGNLKALFEVEGGRAEGGKGR